MIKGKSGNPSRTPKRKNNKFITWLLVIIVLIVATFFVTKPLRISSAEKYFELGDQLLSEKKYLNADLAYQKAISINSSGEAQSRRELAKKASKNILELESFYKARGESAIIDNFELANDIPANEAAAVKISKKLIEAKEYQLAAIPAKTATEMDSQYRDAWLYLGIADFLTARNVELKIETRDQYLNQAKSELEKAKQLDPNYKPTIDYLDQLTKSE